MTINAVIIEYKETSPAAHNRLFIEIVAPQRGIVKRSVSVAVSLLLFALLSCLAFADGEVVRNGDRLSVDFHQATLSQVVETLQRDARIVVRLPASLNDRKITVSFHNLEIGAATKKLLMSASLKSSAVVYNPGPAGLVTIVVLEAATPGSRAPQPNAAFAPAALATAPTTDPAVVHDDEPITPEMRRTLTPTTSSQSEAVDSATEDPDE
jgi:hypothetical protein